MSAKSLALTIFLIAAVLNFGWEMAQMFAYMHARILVAALLSCSLAAIGDAGYAVVLYWAGKVASANECWPLRLSAKSSLMILLAGFVTAVFIERLGIHTALWRYADSMPVLPVLNVGVLPVLQLMILPFAVFWVVKRISAKRLAATGS